MLRFKRSNRKYNRKGRYANGPPMLSHAKRKCRGSVWKRPRGYGEPLGHPHEPSYSVEVLRLGILFCVGLGLVLAIVLIGVLIRQHSLFLFSPTELSAEAQQVLFAPRSKEEATKMAAPSSPAVPPPGTETPSAAPPPVPAPPPAPSAGGPQPPPPEHVHGKK